LYSGGHRRYEFDKAYMGGIPGLFSYYCNVSQYILEIYTGKEDDDDEEDKRSFMIWHLLAFAQGKLFILTDSLT